ncbi:MAG: glyoxylase-like metal-dependent hydrolase (beta-lactamase superfamily II) [Hyphomicrobiaceae bacterium]|jgi:glyoxylase-like metal-dependent hydrolase (beta-lactamase superfamily II)
MTDIEFKTDMEFAYATPRELAPGVVRFVANNPSVFTFKGTNTYIVGTDDLAIIDPGPTDDAHLEAILKHIGGRTVSHIVVTHTHRDHVDGLDKMATATKAKVCGYGRNEGNQGALVNPFGTEYIDDNFNPDMVLHDGDKVSGSNWTLEALFTPGHAPDHLCFAFPEQKVMFSGDHVMGWNTTVVAPPEGSMSAYMASLEKLIGRSDTVFFPGHGGQIPDPQRMVRGYMVHRNWREQAILGAVRDGHTTITDVVAKVYKGLDERLINAASLSVQAHVDYLIEKSLITCDGPTDFTCELTAV